MLECFCEDPMPLDSDDIRATKCGHIFHAECLLRWLRINSTCPQCRTPNSMSDQIRLYPNLSERSADQTEQESVVNEALESLDRTRSELNDMTVLCKKKDEVIATLKQESGEADKYGKQTKLLKYCLKNLSRESLDIIFDDPDIFESIFNSKDVINSAVTK